MQRLIKGPEVEAAKSVAGFFVLLLFIAYLAIVGLVTLCYLLYPVQVNEASPSFTLSTGQKFMVATSAKEVPATFVSNKPFTIKLPDGETRTAIADSIKDRYTLEVTSTSGVWEVSHAQSSQKVTVYLSASDRTKIWVEHERELNDMVGILLALAIVLPAICYVWSLDADLVGKLMLRTRWLKQQSS